MARSDRLYHVQCRRCGSTYDQASLMPPSICGVCGAPKPLWWQDDEDDWDDGPEDETEDEVLARENRDRFRGPGEDWSCEPEEEAQEEW